MPWVLCIYQKLNTHQIWYQSVPNVISMTWHKYVFCCRLCVYCSVELDLANMWLDTFQWCPFHRLCGVILYFQMRSYLPGQHCAVSRENCIFSILVCIYKRQGCYFQQGKLMQRGFHLFKRTLLLPHLNLYKI